MPSSVIASDMANPCAPDDEKGAKRGISSDFKIAAEDDKRCAAGKELPEGVEILDPGYDAQEDLSNLRVLIVDDNRFHRSLIRNALMSQGIHNHWEAEDTKAAERVMVDQHVDLIMMDNNMPGEKGSAFTRRIRMDEASVNRCTPIIMISAYGDEQVINAARNSGVHEYVLKPFNVTTLLKRLQVTFKTPRDFVIAPGYVGPDRRWKQKLNSDGTVKTNTDTGHSSLPPGLCKPEVLVFD